MIKDVRLFSQRELSMLFDIKVRLELWVKVEPNWMENKTLLTEMGYMGARQ
jgi:GTPase Era involved in 16S rRNA processing